MLRKALAVLLGAILGGLFDFIMGFYLRDSANTDFVWRCSVCLLTLSLMPL